MHKLRPLLATVEHPRKVQVPQVTEFFAVTQVIPLRTVSALNRREHWAVRARRVKAERRAALLITQPNWIDKFPATITLVRFGPRKLDDDNLRGAMKGVRDGVADRLGVDDADPRITWEYQQEKGKYGVRLCYQYPRLP